MIKELEDILVKAYQPCEGFKAVCKGFTVWEPENGHVPRGYFGAEGKLEEVILVIVLAEPGDPFSGEKYTVSDAETMLRDHEKPCVELSGPKLGIYLNEILVRCFPNESIPEIMRKVWITESVLCSTPKGVSSTGSMPKSVEMECGSRYLKKQREIFKNAFWVAAGDKAEKRLAMLGMKADFKIYHPSERPYKIYKEKCIELWDGLASKFRVFLNQSR